MWDKLFPGVHRVSILRAQYKRKTDMTEGSSLVANVAGSQASNRSNPHMTNAVEVAAVAGDPASAQRAENDVLSSDLLQQIDDRVPDGYNWSDGYDENLQDALNS